MSNDEQSGQVMDDIDPRYLELIHNKVNSFIKWDIVRFFHDNPHTTDTAEGIARYTGRDMLIVEPELDQLAESGVLETTALGAAYAAGLAVGYWQGLDDLRENWAVAETWRPTMDAGRRDTLAKSWSKAVQRSMGWT